VRRSAGGSRTAKPAESPAIRDLEQRLTRLLGARVRLHDRGGNRGGRIEIDYANLDDLDRILEYLHRRAQ